jgi:hypothetical protein
MLFQVKGRKDLVFGFPFHQDSNQDQSRPKAVGHHAIDQEPVIAAATL